MTIRHALVMLAAGLACAGPALAQGAAARAAAGPPTSMLVLDASGSMWGQIGGRAKIEIAREAVQSMLSTWPAGQSLGLMAYGHRSKGSCTDIELLKTPGPLDRVRFQQAVQALQPKGMTPITASVLQAAEQLRFTERKATVILVSDGEETCNADPCALGQELEKRGVDFTAHVVGFDLQNQPQAKAQLQCLARATGGRYLDAKDAGELNRALREVAQAPVAVAPEVCAGFEKGRPFMADVQLFPDGQTAGSAESALFDPIDLRPGQTARDCQKLCENESRCAVWSYEPEGAYMRSHPVCFRWDRNASFSRPEAHTGFAAGFRGSTPQIRLTEGAVCEAAGARR